MLKEVNPENVTTSDSNERRSWEPDTDENWESFVNSVEKNGIVQTPLLRVSEGGGYEVVVGQRRVEAAKEAGVDTIEAEVQDLEDDEALLKSITENIEEFRENVSPYDRALALKELAEKCYDNGSEPPQNWYSDKLGVSQPTISNWMEPLGHEWEGTVIDPTTQESDDING